MRKLLYGGKIITRDHILEGKALLFGEKMVDIVEEGAVATLEAEKIPFRGFLSPGWIDLHIHGCSGQDTMDATPEALQIIADTLGRNGTTGFLATTMTMAQSQIEKALKCARDFRRAQQRGERGGAALLGVHLEGPFINPAFKGAQEETHIQKPTTTWIQPYLDIIRMITLAPEMDENFAAIEQWKDQVLLSIGHSGADYDCACKAYEAGMRHVTHCFNAMSPMNHRNPGVVGAALLQPYSVDLITDFIHFHPDLLQGVLTLKGPDRCVLITDAMRAAFMEDGAYDLGGQEVTVKDGACRLQNGTIAGSVHKMENALKNTMRKTKCSLPEVLRMMSLNPAELLKLGEKKGSIEVGKDADLVVLDEDLEVKEVYLGGKKL